MSNLCHSLHSVFICDPPIMSAFSTQVILLFNHLPPNVMKAVHARVTVTAMLSFSVVLGWHLSCRLPGFPNPNAALEGICLYLSFSFGYKIPSLPSLFLCHCWQSQENTRSQRTWLSSTRKLTLIFLREKQRNRILLSIAPPSGDHYFL